LQAHGLSLKQIGAVFGGQSHSTVVAQVKAATEAERNLATFAVVAVTAGAGAE
jgi:chromosomal replication initiation ATPase DnaA